MEDNSNLYQEEMVFIERADDHLDHKIIFEYYSPLNANSKFNEYFIDFGETQYKLYGGRLITIEEANEIYNMITSNNNM